MMENNILHLPESLAAGEDRQFIDSQVKASRRRNLVLPRLMVFALFATTSTALGSEVLFREDSDFKSHEESSPGGHSSMQGQGGSRAVDVDAIVRKIPNAKRVKTLRINDSALTSGQPLKLKFFENGTAEFRLIETNTLNLWKGKGNNLDWFIIRKSGGSYSGRFLHKGRQYVLTSLKEGISVLYEQESLVDGCGVNDRDRRVQR